MFFIMSVNQNISMQVKHPMRWMSFCMLYWICNSILIANPKINLRRIADSPQ